MNAQGDDPQFGLMATGLDAVGRALQTGKPLHDVEDELDHPENKSATVAGLLDGIMAHALFIRHCCETADMIDSAAASISEKAEELRKRLGILP